MGHGRIQCEQGVGTEEQAVETFGLVMLISNIRPAAILTIKTESKVCQLVENRHTGQELVAYVLDAKDGIQ